ncbi:M13 family metallopeptidase [Thalassotalea piscium]|uniref:Endothelin-converting enzyme/putative endopeptidase n=1 Tax=Thalassotalea piscium TaxID=1230533 RepID=A0A7X0NK84_9GAMM|nr:M13 family metallopeptidase [Thalassotalea piscium]MBB6544992.1 endothelin-converting enzyme/putative endopeptidase [Thalassotalea piscium]
MKLMLTSAVCSSLLLISGCNTAEQTTTKTSEAPALQKSALTTGISLANMDKSVRPQDNFYRYINGGWLKNTTIPGDKTAVGSFYDLRDTADDNVKAIIEELAATKNLKEGSDEQKVADLFRSYIDTETRDSLGIKPIQGILDTIAAIKNKDELATFFGEYQASGISSPLAFYISVDAKDSSRYATHIWQSGLGLPDKDYYFNDAERFVKLREGYIKHIENMYNLAGLENGSEAAQTIMALETKLADYHWTRVESRDSAKRYNKFAVADLNTLTDTFNWNAFLTAQGVEKQKDIIINQPSFVKGFGETFAQVSLEDWKTYQTFHTLSTFAGSLTTALDKENFDFFSKQLSGREEQRPMWKRGVAVVNSNLGEVIGKVYVKRHFKPEAKSRMSQLVENLRSAYGESINELDWMSEDTKKAAQVKLAAFTPKIGYPDKWEDYSALEINADDLVGNRIRSNKVSHQKQIEKLGGPIRDWEWGMTPQTVNAYYNPTVNEIVFPAAILQPPFFNMAADDAVNYGGIGAVIGHEMGHGFDDQGSRYDAEGNMRNWWTESDLAEFGKRTEVLVEQYNNYQVFDDLNVNGELTLGENIGDLSGVTIAYKAYKASLNGKEAPVIDGLTGDQRFFMGYAQIWRSKMVEKTMRNRVATDPHSPGEFRALGSLSNMPEFYEAFGLKEGDAMYIAPEKRVKIW